MSIYPHTCHTHPHVSIAAPYVHNPRTHSHTPPHIHIETYVHTSIYKCPYVPSLACLHSLTCPHTITCPHTLTCPIIFMSTQPHTCPHMCPHTLKHVYTRSHTFPHTLIHMFACHPNTVACVFAHTLVLHVGSHSEWGTSGLLFLTPWVCFLAPI